MFFWGRGPKQKFHLFQGDFFWFLPLKQQEMKRVSHCCFPFYAANLNFFFEKTKGLLY